MLIDKKDCIDLYKHSCIKAFYRAISSAWTAQTEEMKLQFQKGTTKAPELD